VVEVTPNGPSDGILLNGDLIVLFDGEAIKEMRDLPRIVARTPVGQSVEVQIVRNGETLEMPITLGRLEVGERMIAEARRQDLGR